MDSIDKIQESKESSVADRVRDLETVSLSEFTNTQGPSLIKRTELFSNYYHASTKTGRSLYLRKIISPMGPEVKVLDETDGQIRSMVMLGANDYLGFSHNHEIGSYVKEVIDSFGIGVGGPPLLNGMSQLHKDLETYLSKIKKQDDTMLFSSGYQANIAWVNSLIRDGDYIIYDEANHASFFDGLRMLKGSGSKANMLAFRHNNLDSLLRMVLRAKSKIKKGGIIFLLVEGVYSMDGDLAPLDDIVEISKKYDLQLILDDAHGLGVMGPTGAGTAEHFGVSKHIDITIGTFSKSLSITGAFLSSKQSVIDYMRFFARSYMFSAHMPMTNVAAAIKGLEIIESQPEIRTQLRSNVDYLLNGLNNLGFHLIADAAIIPVPIPEHLDIREINLEFHKEGIFLNSIEFPAVKKKNQRLRLSLSSAHTKDQLDHAIRSFDKVNRIYKLIPILENNSPF